MRPRQCHLPGVSVVKESGEELERRKVASRKQTTAWLCLYPAPSWVEIKCNAPTTLTMQRLCDGGAVGHSQTVAARPAGKAWDGGGHWISSEQLNSQADAATSRCCCLRCITTAPCHPTHTPCRAAAVATHCALALDRATAPVPVAWALLLARATPLPRALWGREWGWAGERGWGREPS